MVRTISTMTLLMSAFLTSNSWANDIKNVIVEVDGKVGIGTQIPTTALTVNGTIRAKKLVITIDNLADYVFEEDYPLMPLAHVEAHIKQNKHLPGIPDAKTVRTQGIGVGFMQNKLLEKIEELTLHMIEQNKTINALQRQVNSLNAQTSTEH